MWPTHPHPHQNNPSFSSLHTKNGGKETQYTPAVDSSAMAAALSQSSEGRGVKRRRTDEAIIAMSTPSPAGSKSLSPADVKTPLSMVSFNSEEGFGSPAKKKRKCDKNDEFPFVSSVFLEENKSYSLTLSADITASNTLRPAVNMRRLDHEDSVYVFSLLGSLGEKKFLFQTIISSFSFLANAIRFSNACKYPFRLLIYVSSY